MKKRYYIMIILSIMFILVSCSGSTSKKIDKNKEEQFNINDAESIVYEYMDCIETNDIDKAKTFLDKEILDKSEYPKEFQLKTSGWSMEDSILAGEAAIFKIKMSLYSETQAYSSIQESDIKVKKNDDGEYKIINIGSSNFKEAFEDEKKLRLRQKNSVKTQLLLELDKMPTYTYYRKDKAKINKVSIPKDKFGVINFGFSGNKIAISSLDDKAYVGVVHIKDVVDTEAQDDNKGKNKGDAKSGDDKEKIAAEEILDMDLVDKAKTKEICFCKEEKLLAVQYERDGMFFKCYNSDSGELVSDKVEEEFPQSKYDTIFKMFKANELIFEVKDKQGQNDKNGIYEMDTDTFEVEKKE